MNEFYQIGEILEDGTIEKGASSQGMIYKSLKAFIDKTGICYVPELDDTRYTYTDFKNMVNGNEKLARILFDLVDWQSPELKLTELLEYDEINFCANCNNTYESYEVDKCPHCGQLKILIHYSKDNSYIYKFLVNDYVYKVTVYPELMNRMNWSWDSLIFADNKDTFAIVEKTSNKEISVLNTTGEVKVFNIETNEQLSINEIIELSLLNKLDDLEKYNIESNNWFSVDHIKNGIFKEDYVFESTPKTSLEVANEVLNFHLNYFGR